MTHPPNTWWLKSMGRRVSVAAQKKYKKKNKHRPASSTYAASLFPGAPYDAPTRARPGALPPLYIECERTNFYCGKALTAGLFFFFSTSSVLSCGRRKGGGRCATKRARARGERERKEMVFFDTLRRETPTPFLSLSLSFGRLTYYTQTRLA